jgi:hypothetical protein
VLPLVDQVVEVVDLLLFLIVLVLQEILHQLHHHKVIRVVMVLLATLLDTVVAVVVLVLVVQMHMHHHPVVGVVMVVTGYKTIIELDQMSTMPVVAVVVQMEPEELEAKEEGVTEEILVILQQAELQILAVVEEEQEVHPIQEQDRVDLVLLLFDTLTKYLKKSYGTTSFTRKYILRI